MPDTVPDDGRPRFYAVHVSNRASRERGTCWVWSLPFATPQEARAECRARLDAGELTLAFVVRVEGADRRVLTGNIYPESAGKIIRHFLDLEDRLIAGGPQ